MSLQVEVTQDDIDAAMLLGASGTDLMEAAIHSALDRRGVPREGRNVKVTKEHIVIDLPPGFDLE
jgi:hypothetical protein